MAPEYLRRPYLHYMADLRRRLALVTEPQDREILQQRLEIEKRLLTRLDDDYTGLIAKRKKAK